MNNIVKLDNFRKNKEEKILLIDNDPINTDKELDNKINKIKKSINRINKLMQELRNNT
jgi:predicted glycosyltransferase